jgi:hypothetical protein
VSAPIVLIAALVLIFGPLPVSAQTPPVFTSINGQFLDFNTQVINGLPAIVVEGTYGIYTISRCNGCAGPARIVFDPGPANGVHRLVLTDARIRASAQATPAQLASPLVIITDTIFDAVVDAGFYPHGVTMDGTFACRGTRCTLPIGNRITVTAKGGDSQPTTIIKAGTSTTPPSLGFTVSGSRSFAKQNIKEIDCAGGGCDPAGLLEITITFTADGDVLNLPGSVGILGANVTGAAGMVALKAAMDALLAAPGTAGGTCGGAIPCACGNTVTASRTLTDDPVVAKGTVCPGDGLIIGASDVELVIGTKNTLRGRGTGTGVTLGVGVTGVTVRSGRIAGFETGVRASDAQGSAVRSLRVTRVGDAAVDLLGDGNTIDGILARRNGAGILVEGHGNAVTGSRVVRSGSGITATGDLSTVADNAVHRSAGGGMAIDGVGARVERNRIAGSGDDGLALAGTGHAVSANVVLGSAGDGVTLPAEAGMTLTGNLTGRNAGFGIRETPVGPPGGTPNVYTANTCEMDLLGDSSPVGLCPRGASPRPLH